MLKNAVRIAAVFMLLVLMTMLVATPAAAFDARAGDNVVIAAGEIIEGDLYIAGRDLVIDGTVNGDVFGAGQTLTVNGEVNGGVTLAGQTVTLNGNVSGGARVAAQTVTLGGGVGRDLLVACADLTVTGQGAVGADIYLTVDTATINGRVDGDVRGSASSVTLAGDVGGYVDLRVDRLTVASGAAIEGDLTYTSDNEADIQPGAAISGETRRVELGTREPGRAFWAVLAGLAIAWKVLGFLMTLVVGIIIILIVPRRINRMANSIQYYPWQSLGWGALILFATPIVAVILMVTIIGLAVGLIMLALYVIAVYLSQVPVALLIGRLIIRQNRELDSRGLMIGALALGLFILLLLSLIPIFGWLISLLTVVFGLGTLVTVFKEARV